MLAYADVRAMLALAADSMPVATWLDAIAEHARLLAGDHRKTQTRIARSIISVRDGIIASDGFLADLEHADPMTARDLIYARYLASTSLARSIAREIFAPAARESRPIVSRASIDQWIDRELEALSILTRKRSKSSTVAEFARAGVVRLAPGGSLVLTGHVPAANALFHLIRDELHERDEATDEWLATQSRAATLFALPPDVMRRHIESLVRDGRLKRSYYSGVPRILSA